MKVVHKTYFNGDVQSVQIRTEDDVPLISSGVMFPGTYDFGVAEYREIVRVTHGQMVINGTPYNAPDGVAEIPAGQEIKIVAVDYASWHTTYHPAQ